MSTLDTEKNIEYFLNSGNGTVTDTRTGLTWMRCAFGQEWDGEICTGNAKLLGFDEGSSLKINFAGYDDWLIPTVDDLKTIIDRTRIDYLIDLEAFPGINDGFFWALSSDPGKPDYVWKVDFKSGNISSHLFVHALQKGYIRLVRYEINKEKLNNFVVQIEKELDSSLLSEQKNINFLVNRFVDNSDGTVTDKFSGLIWACNAFDQIYKAEQAFLLKSTFAGRTDWRLPSIEELNYFLTFDRSNPFIDIVTFSDATISHFWSCTKSAEYPFEPLMIDFKNGIVSAGDNKTRCLVRLVCGDIKSFNSTQTKEKILSTIDIVKKNSVDINFFVDNKNGTFTDSRSKLIWKSYAVGQLWSDGESSGKADILKFNQIGSFCKDFDRCNGWRMPTIDELITLVNVTESDRIVALIENSSPYFFSSSKNSEPPFFCWFIDSRDGRIYESNDRTRGQVRLVQNFIDINKFSVAGESIYKDDVKESSLFEEALPENCIDKIIIDKIEKLEKKSDFIIDQFSMVIESLSDDYDEKNKIFKSYANQENQVHKLNDSISRISARIDSLEDQLKSFDHRFDKVIASMSITRLKTLQVVNQIFQVNDSNTNKVLLEINFLRKVIMESLHMQNVTPLTASAIEEVLKENNEIMVFLKWLVEQEVIAFSELRHRLLPLDLLPSAVIDDINERALNLTGESALEEDREMVIVQKEILLKVIETWEEEVNLQS